MRKTYVIAQQRHRAPLNKGSRRRYSNDDVTNTDNSSSGSSFDWGGFATNLMNTASGVLTSIFGRNNITAANAANEAYEREKRNNLILWIVVGVVLALCVFLVVRKSK